MYKHTARLARVYGFVCMALCSCERFIMCNCLLSRFFILVSYGFGSHELSSDRVYEMLCMDVVNASGGPSGIMIKCTV